MCVCVRNQTAMFLLLSLSTTIGCSEAERDGCEVQGSVTFAGEPIQSGSIAFMPIKGTEGSSTGGPINEGRYHLDRNIGPVTGLHRVEIRAVRKTGRQMKAGEGGIDPEAMIDEIEMFIPAVYNSKSTLTASIQGDTDELNFDLDGDAG